MDDMFVKFALSLLGMGVGTILLRVWKIPAMEEKLDRVIQETDRNRDRIHEINNTLHVHDLRISALEKTKQETHKS